MALTINCEDCGRDYETSRRNTKYCRVCRLWRDLDFIKQRTTTCAGCERKFAPLTTHDTSCPACSVVNNKSAVLGQCSFCKEGVKPLLHKDVSVCGECATDPTKRRTFHISLGRKRRETREANGLA